MTNDIWDRAFITEQEYSAIAASLSCFSGVESKIDLTARSLCN